MSLPKALNRMAVVVQKGSIASRVLIQFQKDSLNYCLKNLIPSTIELIHSGWGSILDRKLGKCSVESGYIIGELTPFLEGPA